MIYLIEGDMEGVAFSAIAFIPVIGQVSTPAKYLDDGAELAFKYGDDLAEAVWHSDDAFRFTMGYSDDPLGLLFKESEANGSLLHYGDGFERAADPKYIHFMQSSIKNQTGSHTVLENAEALKNGTLKATDLPNIKVWKDSSGKMWTLDHRRLGAFKQAGLDEIPIQWATQEEVTSQMWKMTTKNGGTSIKLKLGNGKSMIIK